MKKHPVRVVFIVLFSFLGAWLFVMGSLNYAGFCIPERRFLSDHEKIKIALEDSNNTSIIMINTKDRGSQPYKRVPYASAEEILQKYPDCCKIYYHYERQGDGFIPGRDFWASVLGLEGGWVTARYPIRYLDDRGFTVTNDMGGEGKKHLQNCGSPDSDPDSRL